MNETLHAGGFPEDIVRSRAREGLSRAFPDCQDYGRTMFGASGLGQPDGIDSLRLVPPVFMPGRLQRLIELGREPLHTDVDLATAIGGFRSPLPLYVSALGSTDVASSDLCQAISSQAGSLAIPMVIGENIMPSLGYGRLGADSGRVLSARISAYCDRLPEELGGIVVQQSTEDADSEVWNMVYSDPGTRSLLTSGRLAFELKVGQGAKPGLGGMTVLDATGAAAVADRFALDPALDEHSDAVLRYASPGTFTEEILHHQVRMMRNNYPHVKVWVKLHPGRDVQEAALTAWAAGADAVTVDGAESGSGWAPLSFLDHVGLPLAECLLRLSDHGDHCLLASGRMWDGTRVVKSLALGARAVGLGRAAFLAAHEDAEEGLVRLVACMALEISMIVSALGKYRVGLVGAEDIWPSTLRKGAEGESQ